MQSIPSKALSVAVGLRAPCSAYVPCPWNFSPMLALREMGLTE